LFFLHLLRLNVIVPFLGALINFVLGLFVLSRDSQNEVNRSFCFLFLAIAIWNFKALLLQFAPSVEVATFWMKVFHGGAAFTFAAFFHFALALTQDQSKINRKLLIAAYSLSLILTALIWVEVPFRVLKGLKEVYGGYFPIVGKTYNFVFLANFLFFFSYGLYLLIKKYLHPLDTLEKNRIGLVFIGTFMAFVTALPNFFLAGQIARVYPTGYTGSIISALLFTYAIIKYQLMDVEITLRRGTVYTLASALLTGSFLSGLLTFQLFFEKVTGSPSKFPTIAAIWLVALLFQPVRVWAERLIDKTFFRQRINFQQVISEFSEIIVTIMDREQLANAAVELLERTFRAKSVSIMLLHQGGDKNLYSVEAVAGLQQETLEKVVFAEDNVLVDYLKDKKGWVLREALLPQFYPAAGPAEAAVVQAMEGIKAAISFPLLWGEEKMVGILNLGDKRACNIYNGEEINLLTILSHEAAVAFENANLYDEAKRHLASAVESLATVVEVKDAYTFGHCHRVVNHAVAIGRKLNLPVEQIEALRLGSSLHDVGKIGINKAILNKPGKLTEREFAVIRTHVEIGVGILRPLNLPQDVIDAVKYHHERFDGKGYPYGLKGEQIPLIARIVSVADVFEALTSDRVYRSERLKQGCLLAYLTRGKGTPV